MRVAEGVYSLGQIKGGRVHALSLRTAPASSPWWTRSGTPTPKPGARSASGVLGRSPGDLEHIALTHAHRSHLGGLAKLKRLSGALVYAHEWEADIIAGERLAAARQPAPAYGPLATYPFRIGLALGTAEARAVPGRPGPS